MTFNPATAGLMAFSIAISNREPYLYAPLSMIPFGKGGQRFPSRKSSARRRALETRRSAATRARKKQRQRSRRKR